MLPFRKLQLNVTEFATFKAALFFNPGTRKKWLIVWKWHLFFRCLGLIANSKVWSFRRTKQVSGSTFHVHHLKNWNSDWSSEIWKFTNDDSQYTSKILKMHIASQIQLFLEHSGTKWREHASDGTVQKLGSGSICQGTLYEESLSHTSHSQTISSSYHFINQDLDFQIENLLEPHFFCEKKECPRRNCHSCSHPHNVHKSL